MNTSVYKIYKNISKILAYGVIRKGQAHKNKK